MNFSNFASLFEILTVGSFAYASVSNVRTFLGKNFQSLSTPIVYYKKLNIIKDERDLYQDEKFVYTESSRPLEELVSNTNIGKKQAIINLFKEDVENLYHDVNKKERACYLFERSIPTMYFMSALFGVFILILMGAKDKLHTTDFVFRFSLFLFELMILAFYIIVIVRFALKETKPIKSSATFFTFLVMLCVFIALVQSLTSIPLRLCIPTFHQLGILSIILAAFSFIFHFGRTLQIKYWYHISFIRQYIKKEKEKNQRLKTVDDHDNLNSLLGF